MSTCAPNEMVCERRELTMYDIIKRMWDDCPPESRELFFDDDLSSKFSGEGDPPGLPTVPPLLSLSGDTSICDACGAAHAKECSVACTNCGTSVICPECSKDADPMEYECRGCSSCSICDSTLYVNSSIVCASEGCHRRIHAGCARDVGTDRCMRCLPCELCREPLGEDVARSCAGCGNRYCHKECLPPPESGKRVADWAYRCTGCAPRPTSAPAAACPPAKGRERPGLASPPPKKRLACGRLPSVPAGLASDPAEATAANDEMEDNFPFSAAACPSAEGRQPVVKPKPAAKHESAKPKPAAEPVAEPKPAAEPESAKPVAKPKPANKPESKEQPPSGRMSQRSVAAAPAAKAPPGGKAPAAAGEAVAAGKAAVRKAAASGKGKAAGKYPINITVKGATQPSVNGTYTAAASTPNGIEHKVGAYLEKDMPVYVHTKNAFVSILYIEGAWYCGYYRGQTKAFKKSNGNWDDYYVLEGADVYGRAWHSMRDGSFVPAMHAAERCSR